MNKIQSDFEELFALIRKLKEKYGIISCAIGAFDQEYLDDFLPENDCCIKINDKRIFWDGKTLI